MKKIWFIDEGLDKMGGVERVLNTLVKELKNDYNIQLVSLYKTNFKPYYDYGSNIKIKYLYDKSKLVSKKVKKIKFIYLFFRLIEKVWEKIQIKVKIPLYIYKIKKDDIIVFGRVSTALEFLPYIKKAQKIIVREAIHLYYHTKPRKIKKYFPKKVDYFILSSDENINIYNDFFGNLNNNFKIKMVKIYNPLGIKPIITKDNNFKTIISIGRYDTHKGYDNLIRAFKHVANKHPDWILKIVGDGYYKKEMEILIKDLSLDRNVLLIPATKDVISELNKATIYVISSRFEGYANSLVEAMICGLPCISYNWLVGAEEIIKHEKNGIIVPLKDRFRYFETMDIIDEDIVNLANAMEKLILNKELRKMLGVNAAKLIELRNTSNIIEQWKNIILKVG